MNAVISGRAGVAVVIDGETLMSLDIDDLETLVPRSQSDLRFLLAGATDLVTLENSDHEEIAQRLDLEHDIAGALDMTLIALDPDASMELRAEAVAALDELLADARVVERLELTLYTKPLPGAADLAGAQVSAGANEAAARSLFERLRMYQPAIRAVREAWDAIPDIVFGDGENARAAFHDAVHREGLFRAMGLSYADPAKISNFLFDGMNRGSIRDLHNHYEVLARWCAPIQQASARWVAASEASKEGAGKALGDTEARKPGKHSTQPINPLSARGATSSPSSGLSVVRFPGISEDLTFERWIPRGGKTIALILAVGVTLAIVSAIYAASQGAFSEKPTVDRRWFLGLVSAIQFLVVFAALFYRPRGPKGFLNIDSLRTHDGSTSATEAAIMKNAGYDNPEEWREAKRVAETALGQYTDYWMGLLLSWLVLYFVLTLKYLVEAKMGTQWPPLTIAATFFNNTSSLMIFFCYVVLSKVTVIRKQERLARHIPLWRGTGAIFFFTLVEILVLVALSPSVDLSAKLIKGLDGFSGIAGAITMALFVGRLDSKFLGSRTRLIVFLYAYTAIQPLYESLGEGNPASVFILNAALFLKCLLYLYITWLFQSGRLLFYFTRIRQLDENVEGNWRDFQAILRKAA